MAKSAFMVPNGHPLPTFKKRKGVEVGQSYWGTTEQFMGEFMCRVERIYKNSAMVKIDFCELPEDDERQYLLGDRTVVSLRKLVEVRD